MKYFASLLVLMSSSLIAQISPPYPSGGGGGGGVTTFNARTGDVLPATNDYSFAQLSGQVSVSQQPATTVQAVGTRTANILLKWVTSNTAANSSLIDDGSSITTTENITSPNFIGSLNGTASQSLFTSDLLGGTALGDVPYQNAANDTVFLTGRTAATMGILGQIGNGTVSAAPSWLATTGTGSVVLSISPTGTGMATWARLALNQATGTAPMTITSTTPVTNLTVANHPKEQYCGTTTTCTATPAVNGQIVYGSVALSAGVAVVSGISPAFPDLLYSCTATVKAATIVTNILSVSNTSVSSITITGAAATTDTVSYICVR